MTPKEEHVNLLCNNMKNSAKHVSLQLYTGVEILPIKVRILCINSDIEFAKDIEG